MCGRGTFGDGEEGIFVPFDGGGVRGIFGGGVFDVHVVDGRGADFESCGFEGV